MSWQQWVLTAYLGLGALANIASIGKPRKALDGPTVAIYTLVGAGLIALVVTA